MNQFGHNFRLAIWGESHGHQIGISLDGVPAGIPLSEADFAEDLARRRSANPTYRRSCRESTTATRRARR